MLASDSKITGTFLDFRSSSTLRISFVYNHAMSSFVSNRMLQKLLTKGIAFNALAMSSTVNPISCNLHRAWSLHATRQLSMTYPTRMHLPLYLHQVRPLVIVSLVTHLLPYLGWKAVDSPIVAVLFNKRPTIYTRRHQQLALLAKISMAHIYQSKSNIAMLSAWALIILE